MGYRTININKLIYDKDKKHLFVESKHDYSLLKHSDSCFGIKKELKKYFTFKINKIYRNTWIYQLSRNSSFFIKNIIDPNILIILKNKHKIC